jgi:hypothetical protein
MIRERWLLLVAFSLSQALFAAPRSTATASAALTFSRDVAPILYQHCAGCHHPGDIAPMSLLTYQDVRPWAAAIRDAVLTHKMPPWKADSRYGEWLNDSRLSDSEIAVLKTWAEGPKLPGDPKDMPPAPDFNGGWKIGKPDAVFSIPEHKLSASGPDEYTYVNVPTNFEEDRWIIAAELKPGNRKIVHHAHVFIKDAAEAKTTTPKDVVAQYDDWLIVHEGTLDFLRPEAPVIDNGCSRDDNGLLPGAKIANLGNLMCSYLPGRAAESFPPGTARKLPRGAVLNFQIHYSRATHKEETDVTSVAFIFSKEPPRQVLHMTSISSQLFLIPPGSPNHEVTECHTFDQDILVTSLTPHMHLRGKSMRYIAHLPDGSQETLLYVPAYNFNWQFTYLARKPIFLPKGTRVEVIAIFDNSPNNPLNPDPSKAIRWGAASETEMMDGWMEYVDAAGEPASLTQAKATLP